MTTSTKTTMTRNKFLRTCGSLLAIGVVGAVSAMAMRKKDPSLCADRFLTSSEACGVCNANCPLRKNVNL